MLQAQAVTLSESIAESEGVMEILKEEYDVSVSVVRQELAVAKRMLKTTQSAIVALGGELDEQPVIPDEQSPATDAEA